MTSAASASARSRCAHSRNCRPRCCAWPARSGCCLPPNPLRKLGALVTVVGLVLTAACAAPAVSPAASVTPLDYLPALQGGYFPLHSSEADHLYHIYVRLPEDYAANPGRKYPVVYVLDGDSLFPQIAPQHLFMTIDEKLPEAIIVGIAYG